MGYSFDIQTEDIKSWKVKKVGDWGSARPEMTCSFNTFDCRIFNERDLSIMTRDWKTKGMLGTTFSGDNIERRFGSGMVEYKELITSGSAISLDFQIIGEKQWPAIWLLYEGRDKYFELDLMERFPSASCTYLSSTLHMGNTKEDKNMITVSGYKLEYNDIVHLDFLWRKGGDILLLFNKMPFFSTNLSKEWNALPLRFIINSGYTKKRPFDTPKEFIVTNFEYTKL